MAIVPICVIVQKKEFRTLGMIDAGSEITLMRADFAKHIGLTGTPDSLHLGSCLDSTLIQTQLIKFDICSVEGKNKFHVEEGIVVSSIKGSDRRINWPIEKFRWNHLADLELPAIDSGKVNVLIGQDVEGAHSRLAVRKSSLKGMPRAELTHFGWIVVGRIPAEILRGPSEKMSLTCRSVEVLPCEERLITLVQNFYSTESFGTSMEPIKMSDDDKSALDTLTSSIKCRSTLGAASTMEKPSTSNPG